MTPLQEKKNRKSKKARTESISVYVTPEEKDGLEAEAEKQLLSVSDLARRRLLMVDADV